ncbi:MAG: carbohydrate kinase family protein [Actinomycetota bacterium]
MSPAPDRPWDVLVVGDANPDLVLRGDVSPRFGQEEQLLTGADLVLGGSAAITACGAARLGIRTTLCACVGDDMFGGLVRLALGERGVGTVHLIASRSGGTGVSVVLSGTEDRAILTFPGVIPELRADDVDDALLASVRHLHVSSFFLLPAVAAGAAELFGRAHRLGVSTSLDTNWDPAGQWSGVRDVLRHTDVLLPNIGELLALTGRPVDEPDPIRRAAAIEAAALEIRALGPLLAVKAGALGGIGWGPNGRVSAPTVPVDVVDTTGAGDGFVAGFLAATLRGLPFERALEWASAAGSLSTRAAGGTTAQPTVAELEAVLKS